MGARYSFDDKQLERFAQNLSVKGCRVDRRQGQGGSVILHVEGGWNALRLLGRGFSMDICPEYENGRHVLDFDKRQLPLPGVFVAAHPQFIKNYQIFRLDAMVLLAIPILLLLVLLFGYAGVAISILLVFLMVLARFLVGTGYEHELDAISEAAQSVK